jgi:anaerobic selenocysteine-containing dehydrogenase
VEIIAQIARETLPAGSPASGALDWQSMEHTGKIREAIAKVVPGFEQVASIDKTKQEFAIPGRIFHQPKFPTSDGRAIIHTHELPMLPGGENQIRLMTVRSEGQFNTVVYEEEDIYRAQDRRDVILLHPDDMRRLALAEDQRVTIRSEVGALANILVRSFPEIRPGNALMYYPEANVLVPRHVDPLSKTPAFKSVLVTIETGARALVAR